MIEFLSAIASLTGVLGILGGGIKALTVTNIEKIYMSPSSLVLNRIINIIFFGLLIMLISLSVSIFLHDYIANSWNDVSENIIVLLVLLLLLSIAICFFSVVVYAFFKNKVTKVLVLVFGNAVMFFTSSTTIVAYMGLYYVIYKHYPSEFDINKLLKVELPLEPLLGIILVFLLNCALTFISFTAVRGILDRNVILTEINKDSKLFKDGMVHLYSIKKDKQVVLPILKNSTEYNTSVYPQYIYDPNSDKIIKCELLEK